MPARICTACGRPLDEDNHDVLRYTKEDDEAGIIPKGKMIGSVVRVKVAGRKLSATQHARVWGCRVRLVADSPVSGKTIFPEYPGRRMKEINNRFVHAARVKPGGDLAPA